MNGRKLTEVRSGSKITGQKRTEGSGQKKAKSKRVDEKENGTERNYEEAKGVPIVDSKREPKKQA